MISMRSLHSARRAAPIWYGSMPLVQLADRVCR